MINGRSVLALIPARGGSKGLPGKNIFNVAGRPLIDWTIAAARESRYIDRVVLSSDDDEIVSVARNSGCDVPFKRPAELASDTASTLDVVLHALREIPGFDILVLLQPTSPQRTSADIDAACELYVDTGSESCVSVKEAEESPYWMFSLSPEKMLDPVVPPLPNIFRRQDLPVTYVLNGAIYIAGVNQLMRNRTFIMSKTAAYVMPKERSIDIDTMADLTEFVKFVEG